jgi:hypothetical protein
MTVSQPADTGGCATLISDTSSGRVPAHGQESLGGCRRSDRFRTAGDPTGSLAVAHLTASRRVGTGLRLCRTAFAQVDSGRQGEVRSSGHVSPATGTPRHLSSGGSGWLAPVDGNSGPGLRSKALANRSAPAFRCQRLASRASRSSNSQCQDPSRIRRRIRTGPCTAQTAVRRAGSSCSRTCVVLAILESSPHPGVGGSSRSRPSERRSSACWRACRLV